MGGSSTERANSLAEVEDQIAKLKRKWIKKPIIKTRDGLIQMRLRKGND
jgi:hypothetical protein